MPLGRVDLWPASGRVQIAAFSGSLAFVAAPRISFIAMKEEQTERYLLLPVKNTLGPKAPGCGYHITETHVNNAAGKPIKTTYIEWDQAPVTMSADEALRNGGGQQTSSKLERAQDLLRLQLEGGPVDVSELEEMARIAGISKSTLRKAKDRIGAKSRKIGYQGGFEWYLTQRDEA